MSKNDRKVCVVFSYNKHLFIFISRVTRCVSISAFTSLVAIPLGIMSSATELKNCTITTRIKNYKSIIKKKKEHN